MAVMSEPSGGPIEPTVVVGYPELAPPTTPKPGQLTPALDRLTGQVRALRWILTGCVALLALIAIGLAVTLTQTNAELTRLSGDLAALGAQVQSPPAQPTVAPPTPAASAAASAAAEEAPLGAAPALDSSIAVPGGADSTGAILIGDPAATDVVEVYVDYQCPYCQQWESLVGAALVDRAIEPGSGLLVKQYNMAFLGETSSSLVPAGASARAANAAACVMDVDGPEVFVPFSASIFGAADPSEPPGQFPAKQLVSLAKAAGASAEAVTCIEDEKHVPFVAATTQGAFVRGINGTPTVVLNGVKLANASADERLTSLAAGG